MYVNMYIYTVYINIYIHIYTHYNVFISHVPRLFAAPTPKKHTIEHLKMIMSTPSAIYIILKRGGLFYIYDLYLPYHIDR